MLKKNPPAFAQPVFSRSCLVGLAVLASAANATAAGADERKAHFQPGNLLVSRAVYDNLSTNVDPSATLLPPGCTTGCVHPTDNGVYPNVFNNAIVDGSFGITAKIILDQIDQTGGLVSSLEVPNSAQGEISPTDDQMVTSFSSKSEIALNLSTDQRYVTFMGYLAPIDALDVSNSNTPAVVDPSNPVPGAYFRVTASVDQNGKFRFTKTNAYSGNNGRAAILHRAGESELLYMSGNAGNGGNPQPNGIILGAGAQIASADPRPLRAQDPGLPTPLASFNITQLGDKADKIGKDDNFRGLAVSNNVVYFTKGSGGNGVNTVYFVDTSGFDASGRPLACPTGVGLASATASLPTTPLIYNGAVLQTQGLTPNNMCILNGFPTALKSTTSFPFGVWFANATTLYVSDEGNGSAKYDATKGVYSDAAAQTTAGLQKWMFSGGAWTLAYTLQAGLNLGAPYTIAGYPSGNNAKTSLPWSPATDGLRNITGQVGRDGKATIWAITSTVSGSGDQGADPNKLVAIIDDLTAKTLPASEKFATLRAAGFAEVLRGVSLTPGGQAADRGGERDE